MEETDGVKAIETSSPELCATESILNSLILPNMNDLLRVLNADDIQYYNMQYHPHLVQGQFKSEFQHAEDLRKACTIDIHYDQAFTRRLRSSINKREIWSIPSKDWIKMDRKSARQFLEMAKAVDYDLSKYDESLYLALCEPAKFDADDDLLKELKTAVDFKICLF